MATTGKKPALKSEVDPPVLAKFVLGDPTFQSEGFSIIKVTKDGGTVNYKIPIRSIGVVELKERLEADGPKPPRKLRKVLKGSDLAKELGIEKDSHVEVFDFTDPTYLIEAKEFRTNLFWQIVILAINAEFEDQEGKKVTDFEKKKQALMNSGITAQHLDKILQDVMRMTSDMEGTADFLSGSIWG